MYRPAFRPSEFVLALLPAYLPLHLALTPPLLIAQPPALDSTLLADFSRHVLDADRGGGFIAASGGTGRPQEAYLSLVADGENWHRTLFRHKRIGDIALACNDRNLYEAFPCPPPGLSAACFKSPTAATPGPRSSPATESGHFPFDHQGHAMVSCSATSAVSPLRT